MKTLEKKVYYCDFCKKHGLSRPAMEKHERGCTLNPERACRWKLGGEDHREVDLPALVVELRERAPLSEADIHWLHDEVGGCPACMLAALRQGYEVPVFDTATGAMLWKYDEAVEKFRNAEREAWREDPAIW